MGNLGAYLRPVPAGKGSSAITRFLLPMKLFL